MFRASPPPPLALEKSRLFGLRQSPPKVTDSKKKQKKKKKKITVQYIRKSHTCSYTQPNRRIAPNYT